MIELFAEKNNAVFAVLAEAIRTFPTTNRPPTIRDYTNFSHMQDVMATLPPDSLGGYSAGQITEKAGLLVGIAREQTHDLLNAANSVMPPAPAAVRAERLRQSGAVVQWFGAIGTHGIIFETNDELVRRIVNETPEKFLAFDDEASRVHWNQAGLGLIRPFLGPDLGCPALRHTVEPSSQPPTTLFNFYRQGFTEEFIHQYLTLGLPYTPTSTM